MALFTKKTESGEKQETSQEVLQSSAALQSVIVQPRISEKATKLNSQDKYVFVVARKANKIEVKKAIETSYKVRVVRVNIVKMQGKTRNFKNMAGRTSDFKKAIVTLRKGDRIATAEAV